MYQRLTLFIRDLTDDLVVGRMPIPPGLTSQQLANIEAEITAPEAANPTVDTTALNAAVAALTPVLGDLTAEQAAVDALETPPAS